MKGIVARFVCTQKSAEVSCTIFGISRRKISRCVIPIQLARCGLGRYCGGIWARRCCPAIAEALERMTGYGLNTPDLGGKATTRKVTAGGLRCDPQLKRMCEPITSVG